MKILYYLIFLLNHLKCYYSILSCSDLKNYNCSCFPGKTLEIQCPASRNADDKGLVFYINQETLKINCYKLKDFPKDLILQLNVSTIFQLEMYNCPAPKDFQQIVNNFFIAQLKVLQFEHFNQRITLKATNFQSLDLKTLKLNLLNFNEIDENVFSNLPNLNTLEMERNTNFELSPKLLANLTNLKTLRLSQNNITTIPDNFFENLYGLRLLLLWSNRLKVIKSATFRNLHNLTLLELSRNEIEAIAEDSLKNLKELSKINLSENRLKFLSPQLFKHNTKLTLILIERNPEFTAPDFLFSNLEKLEKVAITSTSLNYLPEHLFENSTSISSVNLQKNNLEQASQNVFRGLFKLKQLHLGDNKIWEIDRNVFKDLISLEEIYLQNNFISKLSFDTFYNKPSLKIINLANNNISEENYQINILENFSNVTSINLSNNFIKKIENLIRTSSMFTLEKLYLNNNLIEKLMLVHFQPKSNLFVDLNHNKIDTISFEDFEKVKIQGKVTFSIINNPINCDCNTLDLYKFLKKSNFNYEILNETVFCQNPKQLRNIRLIDLQPEDLICNLENKFDDVCPFPCSCVWRPYDTSFVVNCTNLNLSEFPSLKSTPKNLFKFNQTEIHLENNNLKRIGRNLQGYENVTKLYLSKNRIENIEWLPSKLQILQLNNNNLSHLNFEILNILYNSNLSILTLDENPWNCDCESTNFSNFLRKHTNLLEVQKIKCYNYSQFLLVNLNEVDLCQDYLLFFISIPIIVFILISMINLILFYTYKQQIKIWLFSKRLCLWWVTKKELDKDKLYDAFISYSNKDEEFVVQNLLPTLEAGPNPYKLCLYFRDFGPGEFISEQVTKSVLNSRRTLVVLSENFLDSVWSKMEFLTALTHAMTEGRARLIIILYGNIEIEQLDEKLQSYLKTNTYVKWGDPYFWSKLKYALPHPNQKLSINEQKITNIINSSDNNPSLVENFKCNSGKIPDKNQMNK